MNTIVIVTHPGIAGALSATASTILSKLPCDIITVDCPADCDTDKLHDTAVSKLKEHSSSVIIFSDLYGSTPHHLAESISSSLTQESHVISGVNLPMVMRTINYIDLPLAELCKKAMHGAQDGIK